MPVCAYPPPSFFSSPAKIEHGFRPLNQMERATIFAASKPKKGVDPETGLPYQSRIPADDLRVIHHNHVQVSYERMQGGFTICILWLILHSDDPEQPPTSFYIWRGASRRSYRDPRKPVRGEMLAFSRMVLYSRPVVL